MTDEKITSYVERYERLAEERAAISTDMSEVLSEAEGNGYDKAALRRVIAWRALDDGQRQEREFLDDLYRAAVEGREPSVALTEVPRDPELAQAVEMFRDGATVREVKSALKVSQGKAATLHRRAKPFLENVRKPGRPSNVQGNVHDPVNIIREMTNDDLGDFALIKPKPRAERAPRAQDSEDFGAKVRQMIEAAGLKIPEPDAAPVALENDNLEIPDHLRRVGA